jgi:hypothetical protein
VNEEPVYDEMDWQLLFELRVSILLNKPLPLPVLRIMRARGWVSLPPPEEWVYVRAVLEDAPEQTIERYSHHVAIPRLLHVGQEELALFQRRYRDEAVEDMLAHEMDGSPVDEEDDED